MANQLFDKGREGFLGGDIDWDGNNIKVALLPTGYTPLTAHTNLSDVTALVTPVATSGNLTSKTITNGIADAAAVTFSTVTGAQIVSFIIYADSGLASTSRLIAYFDTAGASLPLTPNGGNITINWDTGTNKIFKL